MPATTRRNSLPFLGLLSLLGVLFQAPAWAQADDPAVSVLLAFSGSRTFGGVTLGPDDDLYGALSVTIGGVAGGLIYKVEPDGSAVSTLYQLGEDDGISPQAGLLLASDGVFYGTTHFGIRNGNTSGGLGTLFSVRPDGTGYTTLHHFATNTTTNQDSNPINTDGAFPDAALIEGSDGFLYGVTRTGGANGTGTVFKIAKNGTGFTTLHVFGPITSDEDENVTENADGAYPVASLLESNGYFYGTASRGGANGRGTLFRLLFDGSGFGVVHTFTNTVAPSGSTVAVNDDGATPVAPLIDGQDGLLYGVTSQGGAKGAGTLFSVTPDGTVFTPLHDFEGKLGTAPTGAPMLAQNGLLYGTTSAGGMDADGDATSFGTIYSIARDGTAFTSIYSFDGEHGAGPNSALLQLSPDLFVGTTSSGGRCAEGVVFRLDLSGDTVEGETSCGQTGRDNGGGGVFSPALLGLFGFWGGLIAVRRRLVQRRLSTGRRTA